LITETRKYKVSLTLAHQFFSQFGQRKTDAFSSVGSTIIFNVVRKDAQSLTEELRGLVKVEDIISLEPYNAIARIGTDIVRIKTLPPLPIPNPNFRDRIIAESRRKYYKPVYEVQKWIRSRNERWGKSFTPLVPAPSEEPDGDIKGLVYDEFGV
jgi:hypothetical protein